jgi:hypothetical protein
MKYGKLKLVNGRAVETDIIEVNQSELTSDCWSVQIEGLSACNKCREKGKKSCGGGETLKKLKEAKRG